MATTAGAARDLATPRGRVRNGTRRGISLVEVLVVLVILVVGIFAIMQLFPQGFGSLRFTAARSTADSLARQNEEYLRKFSENLPDAIVARDRDTGQLRTDLLPTNLNESLPYLQVLLGGGAFPPPDDPRYSGINQVRTVLGETLKVPPPQRTSMALPNEIVSLYHVLFSPLYSTQPMGNDSGGVVAYTGTPLRRVVFQDPPSAENWQELRTYGPFGYGINYETRQLYFLSTGYNRFYWFEASYRTGTGPLGRHLFDLRRTRVAVGANALGSGETVAIPGTGTLEPGSDVVQRELTQIAPGTPFSADPRGAPGTDDPFQFKVYDSLFGMLGFHPYLATEALPLQAGRGLVLRLDYETDDWHILRQDVTVPSGVVDPSGARALHALAVDAPPIKKVGDVEDWVNIVSGPGGPDGLFEYQGLMRFYPAHGAVPQRPGTPGVDLVLVDVASGYQIDSTTMQAGGNSSNGVINYNTGIIHLADPATFSPPADLPGPAVTLPTAGRHLRLYYRSSDDYGVGTFKSFTRFTRRDPQVPGVPATDYEQGPFGYLLFTNPHSERTVAVDYLWRNLVTGEVRREVGELHRVSTPDAPGAPAGGARPWIRVAHADRDPSKDPNNNPNDGMDTGASVSLDGTGTYVYDSDPDGLLILGVRGVSLHTRVAWREANRFRRVERSTLLTREQIR